MSKLVDKEKLAQLAQALDARAKAAVKAEEERALVAEQAIEDKADANAAAIAAINNKETGLLAQAKSHAQGLVDGEKERAEEQEGLLAGRIETLEGIVGGEAEGAFGVVKKDVSDNKAAIAKLNGGAEEEGSVAKAVADAVKVEADRAEAAEQGLSKKIATTEAFVAAQPAIDKAQNDRLAVIEEMMGLGGATGDKTALQELQDSIDAVEDKADQAQREVDAVEERMTTAEADIDKLQEDVARLDGAVDVEGSVKKQIADAIDTVNQAADGLADRVEELETFKNTTYPAAEQQVRKAFADADTALETKLQGNIDKKVDQTAYNTKVQELVAEDSRIAGLVASEAQTARAAEQALAGRLTTLEGEGEGSVKKALADAKAHAQGLVDAVNTAAENLEDRVEANEAKLTIVQGPATQEGSIAKALADAKAHAETKVAELVGTAPEALNTVYELAKAIQDHGTEYEAYVATVTADIATAKQEAITAAAADAKSKDDALKTALQAEIDADVKAEADRAKAEEQAIRTAFAAEDKKLAGQIKAVESMLGLDSGEGETGAFAQVQADIAALQGTVGNAEEGLVKDVADLKAADVTLQANIDLKVAKSDYNTKVAELEKADTDLGTRIAAFEANGALDVAAKEVRLAAAEKDIDNLQAFVAAQPGKDQAMEQAIQANADAIKAETTAKTGARDVAIKAAIDKEVLDRDAAIATALEKYSTTAEMKQIIGNVVNSLALTMENDQVVLKLGGVDGIKLASVSLELATEDDINDIIAKLDA